MANSKCIGNIRKFTETGAIGGKKLLIVLKEDINNDNTIEKDSDRFLIAEVEYIKRTKKGELSDLVFVNDDQEFPTDLDDPDYDEMEVFEIVDDKTGGEVLPTYKQLALWLAEDYDHAILRLDGTVFTYLPYNINKSYDQVEGITKYNNNLEDDNGWKDISKFIENEDRTCDEHWKIVR
jgi:hypothetical protein